jgi:phenylacetate-CoA ligase
MSRIEQPPGYMLDQVRDIPIYREAIARACFPILEKPAIAEHFPDNWMTPHLADALESGAAEMVLSTGTNHARMQIIRPPLFLLHSYYRLWSEHPDIRHTWEQQCQRVSLTTVLATEHVSRVNLAKGLVQDERAQRRLDARTSYLNRSLDPASWTRADMAAMLADIDAARSLHPQGFYHLDCSSSHLAHFVLKLAEFGLDDAFAEPASIVHAYEFTPRNVSLMLRERFACPIVDLFGSTELGYLYYSDRHGRYHPYLDEMQVELLPLAPRMGADEGTGKGSDIFSLIVSSVRNPFMPLIRYRSGDCVQTSDGSPDHTKIVRFCGREKEMLHTSKGMLSQADCDDLMSAASPDIFIYRLQCTEGGRAQLNYITFSGAPLSSADAHALQDAMREATGLAVEAGHRAHVDIGKSGKYAWLSQ